MVCHGDANGLSPCNVSLEYENDGFTVPHGYGIEVGEGYDGGGLQGTQPERHRWFQLCWPLPRLLPHLGSHTS